MASGIWFVWSVSALTDRHLMPFWCSNSFFFLPPLYYLYYHYHIISDPHSTTTGSVDVGYRWAADSPRWIFRRGEEVWLCVAAADGWSHRWVCISDWDCPLRPPQSLPTGQSGTVMISSLISLNQVIIHALLLMCESFLFIFEIPSVGHHFFTVFLSVLPGSWFCWFQRQCAEQFSVHDERRRTAVIVEGQWNQCS